MEYLPFFLFVILHVDTSSFQASDTSFTSNSFKYNHQLPHLKDLYSQDFNLSTAILSEKDSVTKSANLALILPAN